MGRSVHFAQGPGDTSVSDEERTPVRTKPYFSPIDTGSPTTPTGPQVPTPPLSPTDTITPTAPTAPQASTPPISPGSPTTPATPASAVQAAGKRNRKSRSRARKTEPVDPTKKRIETLGFKKYWVDQRGNRTPIHGSQDSSESDRVHPPPPQPEIIQMSARSYAKAVEKLRERASKASHKDGSGTYDDPEIIWLERPPHNNEQRYQGILKVCRDACFEMGQKRLWIRALDHSTTRTITHTATRNGVQATYGGAHPHITVYMGATVEFEYDGHLYCEYEHVEDADGYWVRVPVRLGRPGIRTDHPDWLEKVVEVLDRKFLRDKARQAGFLDSWWRGNAKPVS